jgi:hypothetical protein
MEQSAEKSSQLSAKQIPLLQFKFYIPGTEHHMNV